ncbi:DedA family protein [Williamsia deligens]|uniref:DedA family protein n=1 Tax=Williamsia deligens TaxID=321325 RepID=A0ABW3G382_9NOCA|nr:DedA family protein [Williamsia deligens]MCP2194295.1 membrane-associated protein [Williamsia deligens]
MQSVIDWLVDVIATTPPWVVYLVVWALVYCESAALLGLILPGETALLAGGVAAAVGETSVGWLIVGACVAAIAGDATGFSLGRWSGPRMMRSRLGRRIGEERWDKVTHAIQHNGVPTVLGARWIGYVRTLTPFVAGMSRMPVRLYLTANVLGGVVWVTAVGMVGYLVGATVGARLLLYGGVVVGVAAVIFFAVSWWRSRHDARDPAA